MAEDQTKRGEDTEIQNIKNKDIEIKVSTSRKNRILRKKEILLETVTICFRGLNKYDILITNVKRTKQVIKN